MSTRMDEYLRAYGYSLDRPSRRIAESPRGQRRAMRFRRWLPRIVWRLDVAAPELAAVRVRADRWV